MNCVRDTCALIRATAPPWSARLPTRAAWSEHSTSRGSLISTKRSALIHALPSPDARAVSICVRPAITPNGNSVLIDANVCAGCGSCASVCPTGAASYALPSADALMRRLRTLLQTYRKAGGSDAVVLFHDGEHGEDIIDALARFGEGLPANVLPLRINEVTQLGPELLASVFAYGGSGVAVVTRAKPRRLRAAGRETRRARNDVPRASSRCSHPGRCRAAAAGRPLRHREAECRRLHTVPCLRHR